MTDAFWILKRGSTAGRSPRDQLQRVLGARAKANEPLQRFLAGIGTDNPN